MRRIIIVLLVAVLCAGCSKKKKKDKYVFLPPANPNILLSLTVTDATDSNNNVTDATGALPAPAMFVFSGATGTADVTATPVTEPGSVISAIRYKLSGATVIQGGMLTPDFPNPITLDSADAAADNTITILVGFDENGNWALDDIEVERRATVEIVDPADLVGAIDIDADTNQSGAVDGSPIEEVKEKTTPGVIVLPNIDDDDAVSAATMAVDASNTFIDGGPDVNDISPLIVRRKSDLAASDEVAVQVPVADVGNIRIFPAIEAFCSSIIDSATGALVTVDSIQYREAVLDSDAIRAGDVTLGIEGVVSAGNATVVVSLRDATTKTEHDNDSLLVTVAPIIMLSNLEGTERNFVSGGDPVFASAVTNAVFAATGVDATVVIPFGGDQWVQDEFQALYALTPSGRIPIIQNTARDRELDSEGAPICFQYNYAHIEEGTSSGAADFGGNMEVSPPVPAYPAGVIYSSTELSAAMQAFYNAQRVQTRDTGQILLLDATWLLVGHIDEFVSFIPMPSTADSTDFRLIISSPAVSKAILDDLAASGHGSAVVFTGKGGFQTNVSTILADSALWTHNRACQVDCDTGRDLLVSTLGLTDCITKPVAGGSNAGSGALARAVMMWPNHTMGALAQWRITFATGTAYAFEYDAGLGWVADGTGDRSTDSLSASGAVAVPLNYWTGTPLAGDTFTFSTTTDGQIVDLPVFFYEKYGPGIGTVSLSPDVVNLQVVSGHLLVCDPFGPMVSGQDRFKVFMDGALSHTGCTIHYIDDWDIYHAFDGEIHCGTEVIRVHRPEFKWWGN